jgi:hypothetical protein
MNTDKEGRVTPCEPWLAFVQAAGRGLPALPNFFIYI